MFSVYVDEGNGPPVLFVHGSNVDSRIWDDHRRTISARYRLIAPSLPWSDAFSADTHAEDLAEFISALQIAPATIVGWSYGGAGCLALACRHPELVGRLFLYEPAVPSGDKTAIDDRAVMTRLGSRRRQLAISRKRSELPGNGVNITPALGTCRSTCSISCRKTRMLRALHRPPPKLTRRSERVSYP
jgi:pimeloyl-ACP methyl ester carboxylesterase